MAACCHLAGNCTLHTRTRGRALDGLTQTAALKVCKSSWPLGVPDALQEIKNKARYPNMLKMLRDCMHPSGTLICSTIRSATGIKKVHRHIIVEGGSKKAALAADAAMPWARWSA